MSETSTTSQKIAAELIGTLLLVFFGCGAVVMTTLFRLGSDGADTSAASYLAIAIAFGFALLVGIYAFGRVSGAHFNPAVSVGAAMSGRMPWSQVPIYAAAQVAGGIIGAALLFVVVKALPDTVGFPDDTLGQNSFGNGAFPWWGALVVEVILTAIFVTVILAVTDDRNEHPASAPLAIGLALVVIHLFAIPLTGTSVNPARSIGPALFSGTESIKDLWLFIVAPLLGAAVAGLGYPAIFGHGSAPVAGSGLALGRPTAGTVGAPVAAVPGYGAPDQYQQEWNQQAYPQGGQDTGQAAQAAQVTQTTQSAQATQVTHAAAYEPEPIIQDGWQWDHQAQEWKPLEHWTDPGAAAAAEPTVTTPLEPGPLDQDTGATSKVDPVSPAAQQPWDPDDDQTQVRRREP